MTEGEMHARVSAALASLGGHGVAVSLTDAPGGSVPGGLRPSGETIEIGREDAAGPEGQVRGLVGHEFAKVIDPPALRDRIVMMASVLVIAAAMAAMPAFIAADAGSAKDRHLVAPYPAWSAIGVSQLITEGALVEIRAIAVDPRR